MSDFKVVIPSRFASTRLPGKPLRMLDGKYMLQRVHEKAMDSGASEVVIATDDERIEKAALGFGAIVSMTSADHQSGTERIAEVCEQRGWAAGQIIVNLQGDEPLMPAELIGDCAALLDDCKADMATLASHVKDQGDLQNPNIVKVVVNSDGNALYFSRAQIPFVRDAAQSQRLSDSALQHHGIYAYRCEALRRFVKAGACDLEQLEQLEQLRALWIGMTIRVGIAALRPGPGIDTEEDLRRAESLLQSYQ
jgi:3-deoxy-manno-octulosonate cytidylyltransferase (CMP-KDO synthetase)